MFFYILAFISLLVLVVICFLIFDIKKQNYEKGSLNGTFHSLLYRPIDIVHLNYFKNITPSKIENKIYVYSRQVIKGYHYLKNQKIVVAGLLYNAESQVEYLKSWFNELKLVCKECVFAIVENNSQDNTRMYLQKWKKEDPLHIHLICIDTDFCDSDINSISVNNSSPDSNRIRKMAFLRNVYVKYIQEHFKNFDYVFIKDLDLEGHLFWDGIFHSFYCFQKLSNIDVITCNGLMKKTLKYYDTFAYAKDSFEIGWNFGLDKRNHDADVLEYVSKKYQENMELDKVASAFGGFAIYKMNLFKDKFYSYDPNRLSCEHCLYHLLYQNVYVNPHLIFLIQENKT